MDPPNSATMELGQYAYDLKYFTFNDLQVSAEREFLVREVARKVVGHAINQIGTPKTSALLEAQKETVVDCIVKSCSDKIKCLRDLDSKNLVMQALLFLEEKQYEDMEDIIQEEMEFHSRIHETRSLYNLSKLPKFISQMSTSGQDIKKMSCDLPPSS
ncbi:uncharacterized protein LOC6497697 isoform X2 [Drosophila ananassae]|uniref:uncharacterized protein LOC6497697 isoform X2 n=1 Tax=Drosophila ananassae TaxID=7217 RepID=UPI0013A5E61A|nr:uncharacterized protein LOC6497697 isoform X2 [Drosophila ananassae]